MQNNFKNFIAWGAGVFVGLVALITVLLRFFVAKKEPVFFLLATSIILSWILLLTLYYIWAIYFYNINRGWTDSDWEQHRDNLAVDATETPPEENPHDGETLGLPPGTVRGTIALSVLVGGLAMLVASLAMPGKFHENEFIIDHFEYIKTAFLMVIAFYFGSKSLENIGRKQVLAVKGNDAGKERNTPASQNAAAPLANEGIPAGDISKPVTQVVNDFEDPGSNG